MCWKEDEKSPIRIKQLNHLYDKFSRQRLARIARQKSYIQITKK